MCRLRTQTSELIGSSTEMAWDDGFVSSGISGATETEKKDIRGHDYIIVISLMKSMI